MHRFVGKAVFVRTVTMHYVGQLDEVTPEGDLVLSNASWVADSGRFGIALASGTLNEVERYPDGVVVARVGLIDVSPWNHELPTVSK